MFTVILSVLVAIVSLIFYLMTEVKKPKNFPPGPRWYPLVGCNKIVLELSKKHGCQWKGLSALANEYKTNILGLKLGKEVTVVVYGEKNIRQIFHESEFEGRPDNFFLRLRCFGKKSGITFADGPLWREHRKFTVKELRNVGFGKSLMEMEIQNDLFQIINIIESQNGHCIQPRLLLPSAVMNCLWKYAAGERIEKVRLEELLNLLHARSNAFTMTGGWLNMFPWCRFLIPEISGYGLIQRINTQLSNIIEEAIQKHKNNEIQGTDFIYAFLREMESNKNTFTDEQLRVICLDILIAGSQTTSNVLEFALLMALSNPVLQDKIYEEIHNSIGKAVPCWTDSVKLVYTSAFLLEVQRYYTIVPLAGPRRVLEDTTVDGYHLPKGTSVLIALADLHFDSTLWEEPNTFRPERFIDNHGALKSTSNFYPFGLGRRRCPGDSLAKSFIFILFVGIIQKYKIVCSNGVMPSNEPVVGILSAPKPYSAEFVSRKYL